MDFWLKDYEVGEIYVDDLVDFYDKVKVTPARAVSNALQGVFRAKDFKDWNCAREDWDPEEAVVAALGVLPMGDGNAVEIAQAAHVAIGTLVGLGRPELHVL